MADYTNADGLRIRWGQDEGKSGSGGEFSRGGPRHHVEHTINMAELGTAPVALDRFVVLPIGARLESVEIIVDTAVTGGGTFNLGLYRTDGTTAIDADGLLAAVAATVFDTAGEKTTIRKGDTGAGAMLGTSLTNPAVITADYDTTAFTAGRITVSVYWYVPSL